MPDSRKEPGESLCWTQLYIAMISLLIALAALVSGCLLHPWSYAHTPLFIPVRARIDEQLRNLPVLDSECLRLFVMPGFHIVGFPSMFSLGSRPDSVVVSDDFHHRLPLFCLGYCFVRVTAFSPALSFNEAWK